MSGDIRSSNQTSIRIPVVASFSEPPLSVVPQALADSVSSFSINPPQPELTPYKALFADWASRGFAPTLESFEKKVYPFQVGARRALPLLPPYATPFHIVTLRGHPEVEVPWTDPYLLAEWESFLMTVGVTREVRPLRNGRKINYYFQEKKLLEISETDSSLEFKFFSYAGKGLLVKRFQKPRLDPVSVILLDSKGEAPTYEVTVSSYPFKVIPIFPKNFSEKEKRSLLVKFGEMLRRIPAPRLRDFSTGLQEEPPLTVIISTRDKAREMNFYDEGAGGMYFSDENQTWIELSPSGGVLQTTVIHEIAGHADDDFHASDDNAAFNTAPDRSGLRDYYAWKLKQCFSDKDLATYMRASRDYHKKYRDPKSDSSDVSMLQADLEDFRSQALKCFVSPYAAEGSREIKTHLETPYEDYAEVVETFYRLLSYERGPQQDRLLSLVGLDYLMDQYQVDQIGAIRHEEVYSREAFETVLGISLNPEAGAALAQINEDQAEELPGARWVFHRTGPVGAVRIGEGYSRVTFDDKNSNGSLMTTAEFLPGYRWNQHAAGVVISGRGIFNEEHFGSGLSVGLWGQLLKEKGSFTLFVEPQVGGGRVWQEEDDRNVIWGGIGAGLSYGGFLSLTLQGKVFRGEEYQEESGGAMIGLDLYHLFGRVF